ncbi:hypothetical protein BFP72_06800 [Reichenbachiella sp. 5M10]|uniref:WapI family immunity protein n=1 Tax=Reichenbachiella sp. 5M10 TaxID=1889772 RepID=UPI000C15BCB9|nr:hypothetical protein [Reichenbachiella sp. 5M10]PIB35123.1 hypothetical protein BFP72_06800 [Reichenbachiella sp. 5M10]
MIIDGANGALELKIIGYQYPSVTSGHDGNWLRIQLDGRVDGVHRRWVDPCLLTWELAELIDWLRSIRHADTASHLELFFVEPMLSFGLLKRESTGMQLQIRLDEGTEDCVMTFEVDQKKLDRMVEDLSGQLVHYPVRS